MNRAAEIKTSIRETQAIVDGLGPLLEKMEAAHTELTAALKLLELVAASQPPPPEPVRLVVQNEAGASFSI
jgi:hypothetical protein